MFERSVLTPIMVGSFMNSCFIIQSTVAFVAVKIKASTFTDLGIILRNARDNVPISANA